MTDSSRAAGDGPTAVTIFGRTYRLRGDGDDGYLKELAELVDGKMREVEAATGTADTLKIAILASLNIADDYLKASQGEGTALPRKSDADRERRLARMVTLLDEALAG
jgi:cell division protein ZapA